MAKAQQLRETPADPELPGGRKWADLGQWGGPASAAVPGPGVGRAVGTAGRRGPVSSGGVRAAGAPPKRLTSLAPTLAPLVTPELANAETSDKFGQ